ncbi:MAG: UMP kinase [Bacilli bacterium]|nr:UMP kinase [Bacilli bacterium]
MKRVILKLSGEALSEKGIGISAVNVKKIAKEVKDLYDQKVQIGIVVGAGNIWRGRDAEENEMERANADYMGMLGTVLNSLALANALENLGIKVRTMSALHIASVVEPFVRKNAIESLERGEIVIFAGGTGHPFFSTDTTSALRAAEIKADMILMAKNGTDGVYDDDPRKNPNAKKYQTMTFDEITAKHLKVMDSTAAILCNDNNINIIVFDMNVSGNIAKAINHPEIGTYISK